MSFRPRAMAHLTVPVMGNISDRLGQASTAAPIEFDVPVIKATITKNDFNSADECELVLDYSEAGVDPRLISNATVAVYIGLAGGQSNWNKAYTDLRFLGIVTKAERNLTESTVTIQALDYTTLFIAMKPYPDDGAPKYTMTLRDAWAWICDHVGFYDFAGGTGKITSSVKILRDRLFSIPSDAGHENIIVGKAVLDRMAKFGVIQVEQDNDAWAIWRKCIDALGFLTWIENDNCYVTQASSYYTETTSPAFIYGQNVEDITETRDGASLNGKGIHLTTYDPIAHQALEAFFPPRDDPRWYKKRVPAKGKQGTPELAPVSDYEHQNYQWAITKEQLEICAKRVWLERSRQELSGKLKTHELTAPVTDAGGTVTGQANLLDLKHGDFIKVELEQYALDALRRLKTVDRRFQYLRDKGYHESVALLLANDADFITRLKSTFVVKTNTISYDTEAPECTVEIEYLSLMNDTTGSTDWFTNNLFG